MAGSILEVGPEQSHAGMAALQQGLPKQLGEPLGKEEICLVLQI